MDSNRRTLELLYQDLINDWGELHDQVKAARVNANQAYVLVMKLENLIDTKVTQQLATITRQLEAQQTLDVK